MIAVYINYPHARICIHAGPHCSQIQKRDKKNQRIILIDRSNLEGWLARFEKNEIRFAPVAGVNDIWIKIDLGEQRLEEDLVKTIREKLGRIYRPIARASIQAHCMNPGDTAIDVASHFKSPVGFQPTRSDDSIRNRSAKIDAIINTITSRSVEFNRLYRGGPSLYFYKRTMALRRQRAKISAFISDDYNLEILYATLVSWDMNSRGAKLKYFDAFQGSILSCLPAYEAIEEKEKDFRPDSAADMLLLLKEVFVRMKLMETAGKLVSNAKCLHFLFPSLFMPMDRTNTLQYLFGNTNESEDRYLAAMRLSFEVMQAPVRYEDYLDDGWNQTIPKMIDNAIILLQGKSLKKK
jgi:hypothetical protein